MEHTSSIWFGTCDNQEDEKNAGSRFRAFSVKLEVS